ncbi:MAG: hypothetical protein MZV63_63035 [Marinilabiliales bacterium]|nr:hypothetical protein [Marinilabiliales bacterium]
MRQAAPGPLRSGRGPSGRWPGRTSPAASRRCGATAAPARPRRRVPALPGRRLHAPFPDGPSRARDRTRTSLYQGRRAQPHGLVQGEGWPRRSRGPSSWASGRSPSRRPATPACADERLRRAGRARSPRLHAGRRAQAFHQRMPGPWRGRDPHRRAHHRLRQGGPGGRREVRPFRRLDAEGALPHRGQEDHGLRDRRADGLAAPGCRSSTRRAAGPGLVGMWKAFDEMETLGWIGTERPTHGHGPGRGLRAHGPGFPGRTGIRRAVGERADDRRRHAGPGRRGGFPHLKGPARERRDSRSGLRRRDPGRDLCVGPDDRALAGPGGRGDARGPAAPQERRLGPRRRIGRPLQHRQRREILPHLGLKGLSLLRGSCGDMYLRYVSPFFAAWSPVAIRRPIEVNLNRKGTCSRRYSLSGSPEPRGACPRVLLLEEAP